MATKPHVIRAVKAFDDRLIAAGGTKMTLKLSPEATVQLNNLTRKWNVSRTAAIERLLLNHLQMEKLLATVGGTNSN